MNWRTGLTLFVVLFVLLFLLNALFNHRDERHREEGWNAWQASNGTMDGDAVRSYKKIRRLPDRKRTYTEEFILDQILNTNVPNGTELGAANGGVIVDGEDNDAWLNTLILLNDSHQLRFPGQVNTRRNRATRNRAIHPLFILDRLEARVTDTTAPEMRDRIQACRREYADNARKTVVADTLPDEETTRQKEIERVLAAGVSHTSDPQNVHDNAANIALRKTLERLKWDRGGDNTVTRKEVRRCIEECSAYIDAIGGKDDEDKGFLKMALNRIAQGSFNDTFNDTEDRIFATVWDRTKNPANLANQRVDLIKEAIMNSMREMVNDKGETVCSSGRCGRLVDSLTMVDHDPELGKPRTVEMVRNEIMEKSQTVLQECINEAESSNRAYMKALADEYRDASKAIDESPEAKAAKTEFHQNLSSRINVMVDGFRADLSPKELENVRQYCLVAIV